MMPVKKALSRSTKAAGKVDDGPTREELLTRLEELERLQSSRDPETAVDEDYHREQDQDLPKRPIRDPEGFDEPVVTPRGCLLVFVFVALLLAVVWLGLGRFTGGGQPTPGPSPRPAPVVIDDYAKRAEIAGKLEDRLYADVFESLAADVERGRIKTSEAWHGAAKKRFYDARYKAQEGVHQALNQIFSTDSIDDPRATAKSLREIASGFRRSGK